MTKTEWMGVAGATMIGAAVGSTASWEGAIIGAVLSVGAALIILALGRS